MKHRQHQSHRFAPHVQAVLDFVRRFGAEVVGVKQSRRVMILLRIAGRVFRILVSTVLPKGQDANHYAAKECERVRALCAGHARMAT